MDTHNTIFKHKCWTSTSSLFIYKSHRCALIWDGFLFILLPAAVAGMAWDVSINGADKSCKILKSLCDRLGLRVGHNCFLLRHPVPVDHLRSVSQQIRDPMSTELVPFLERRVFAMLTRTTHPPTLNCSDCQPSTWPSQHSSINDVSLSALLSYCLLLQLPHFLQSLKSTETMSL